MTGKATTVLTYARGGLLKQKDRSLDGRLQDRWIRTARIRLKAGASYQEAQQAHDHRHIHPHQN